MATGRDKHQDHQAAVAALGRTLSRRARNKCELCETSASLKVVEVEPTLEEPEEARAILICSDCERALNGGEAKPNTLRFLESVVWSQTLPVQLSAVRLLRKLSDEGATWATDCLDGLFLDPEIEGMI
jgi:protein PhnA